MKKRYLKIAPEFQELSMRQLGEINGGETGWYWLAYYSGTALAAITEYAKTGPLSSQSLGIPNYAH
jgi:hypothetical protein